MPYVTRGRDGGIISVHATQSAEATEKLAPRDPELRAFLGRTGGFPELQTALVASDLEMARVL